MRAERLQKILAAAGLGSRREIESWIEAGRVKVNGVVAALGVKADPSVDRIALDGRIVRLAKKKSLPRVLLYNKPEGEVCSTTDDEGRPTVFNTLPRLRGSRWVMIGRLDINTSGLLLFTDDGNLANALMHPSSEIEREYLVRVRAPEVAPEIQRQLVNGVELEDGPASFSRVSASGRSGGSHSWYSVVIAEGRNREVRRLWEAVGLQVSRLKRTRYGVVSLPAKVRRGRWLELTEPEIKKVLDSVGLAPSPASSKKPAAKKRRSRRS